MTHERKASMNSAVIALAKVAARAGVVTAALALLLVAALAAPALAVDAGCAALGGTEVAGECQISTAVSRTGTFNIGSPSALVLHILGGGSIVTGAGGITLNINGGLVMESGALIDGNVAACATGGPITINVTSGDIDLKTGSTIRSNSCSGGFIQITQTGTGTADIDGLVESVGSISGTAGGLPGGGPITIKGACALTISDTGVVSSRGSDPGADLVHIEGCVVTIDGKVESTGSGHAVPFNPANSCSDKATNSPRRNPITRPGKPQNSTGCVEIWSGTTILIDSTNGHHGEVNADIGFTGG